MRVGRQTLQKVAKAARAPKLRHPPELCKRLVVGRGVAPTLRAAGIVYAPEPSAARPVYLSRFACRNAARSFGAAGMYLLEHRRHHAPARVGDRKPTFILPEASVRSTADTAARKSGGRPPSAASRYARARASKWRFAMSPFSRSFAAGSVSIAALDAQLVRSSSDDPAS